MRRSRVRLRLATLGAATMGLLLLVYFVIVGRAAPNVIVGYGLGIGALLTVSLWYFRQISGMNRFGIFEAGLAPTRKVKGHRHEDRWILSTDSIANIEYKSTGSDDFPQSHFSVRLRTREGEELEIDATEIDDQFLGNHQRTATAQSLLREFVIRVDRRSKDVEDYST